VNPDERPLVIAVLGLGEAGSVIARDLVAAGAVVRGYDPAVAAEPGITDTPGEAEAARGHQEAAAQRVLQGHGRGHRRGAGGRPRRRP